MPSGGVPTIVFGVIASVLALVTILQAYLRGHGSRGRHPADRGKTVRINTSNMSHSRTGLRSSPPLVRSSTCTTNHPRWSKSALDALDPGQFTYSDGACSTTLGGSCHPRATKAGSSTREWENSSSSIRFRLQMVSSDGELVRKIVSTRRHGATVHRRVGARG